MVQLKYAQVERAVALTHGISTDPGTMKTFRARVRNFQKLGLVPSAPGKGRKIMYSYEDIMIWALCFELSSIGLSPSAIKMALDQIRPEFVSFFELKILYDDGIDVTSGRDVYLIVGANFLQWSLQNNGSSINAKICFADDIGKSVKIVRSLVLNLSLMKLQMQKSFDALGIPQIEENVMKLDY